MINFPLRPLAAVLWDALRSLLPSRFPPPRLLPPPDRGVPVYVMLPLDAALPSAKLQDMPSALAKLKKSGVTGVMMDVWWGLCEPEPRQYDFAVYKKLFAQIDEAGLKAQATMSMHACGGNIGDEVNIPLPGWVVKAGDEHGIWFKDRHGWQNREYISFGADHERVLDGRSAVEAYRDFVAAFVESVSDFMERVIVEVQIGLGPCGELRYPSYPLNKWEFPGIGEFQCFDRFLAEEVEGMEVKVDEFGGYNDRPRDCEFFRRGYKSEKGKKFLDWYAGRMLKHAEDVLKEVRPLIKVKLAVKISGIHWWKMHSSRAAEATSGYVDGSGAVYTQIAEVLKRYEAVLDFTCLEMRTIDQPFLKARCAPRQLVREVFRVARRNGVEVAGENALGGVGKTGYRQIVKAFEGGGGVGFTLLRLGEDMLQEKELEMLETFVKNMNKVC